MANRKNAMLTSEDRRWLTGEKTYEGKHAKQQRYQRRRDIRDRVYNSILDFTILLEHLDEAERKEIFEGTSADGRVWELDDDQLREGVCDALAFLISVVDATTLLRPTDRDRGTTVADMVLFEALYRAGQSDGVLLEDLELRVQTKHVSIPDLLSDLEAGAEISSAGLRHLIERDIVDKSAVQAYVREMAFGNNSLTAPSDSDRPDDSVEDRPDDSAEKR
ncbi:hypothetical protein ACNS7O_15335 (plasmid) [Haloferacaceae archaeon DSL9]